MKKVKLGSLGRLYAFIVIGGIAFLLVSVSIGRWYFIAERTKERQEDLKTVTTALVSYFPSGSEGEILRRQGNMNTAGEENALAMHQTLQPIVERTAASHRGVAMGYYSLLFDRIVAISPGEESMAPPQKLALHELKPVGDAYLSGELELADGKPALIVCKPVYNQGEMMGYGFAVMSMADIRYVALLRNIFSFAAGLMLLIVITLILQLGFQKIKRDLQLFADSLARGDFTVKASGFPELLPVLELIRNQSQHMARLDRLSIVGQMAASIGHEIRNPLTVVRGYLQFLGDKADLRGYREEFSLMIAELDRANSIITEYLSLAKSKSVTRNPANLNDIILEINPLLQADGLEFNCQVELSLQPVPSAGLDTKEVRQLILNLVRNAFQAMPEGGKVVISTCNQGDGVVLSIKDEGQGISPTILEKLGTPFLSTKENGTGLGLAVSYQIADRHNASIKVDSKEGIGTVFHIVFPKKEDDTLRPE